MKRRRTFTLRDDGELFNLLDERLAIEQRAGRRKSREAMVREILHGNLRTMRRPPLRA